MEDGLLNIERGAKIGGAAVAFAGGACHQRQRALQRLAFLLGFDDQRGVVVEAQHRAIRGGAQRPLPAVVVVVGLLQRRQHAHRFKQRIQRDVQDLAGARGEHDVLAQRGQERRRGNLHVVAAGSQAGER